ncbi:MAG: patatin-like phospholipase family protein, partial [Acidobacteriota bacterium]|nr:patatin-like phospholipase family protein [Acidobacteriota bacterium]
MSHRQLTLGSIQKSEEELAAGKPIPLDQVLAEEYELMRTWRTSFPPFDGEYLARAQESEDAKRDYEEARKQNVDAQSAEACRNAYRLVFEAEIRCLTSLNRFLLGAGRSALCLSGGGIRSATFSLGVLQGLARLQVLDQFDYLSTVSGGGYIGSWLSAWVKRAGSITEVSRQLADEPQGTIEPEPAPIRHLRAYNELLHPETRLLSADAWTRAATMGRNIFLNWLILVPAIAMVLLLPRLCLALVTAPVPEEWHERLGVAA